MKSDEIEKGIAEFDLMDLFDDLQKNAYNAEYHNYHFKEANQIIRKHFEARFASQAKITDEECFEPSTEITGKKAFNP
ncbi:hypothetical protein D4R86_04255 [bacterium]|nr:MAG: hypothetical protein D4R86_04255 [bacterium]